MRPLVPMMLSLLVAAACTEKRVIGAAATSDAPVDAVVDAGAADQVVGDQRPAEQPATLWAISAAAGEARDIAVDSAGNVYVTGSYESLVSFGAATNISGGTTFVAKLDSAGQWLWAASDDVDGAAGSDVAGIAVDGAGNCLIHGTLNHDWRDSSGPAAVSFGSTRFEFPGGPFVAKLDREGTWQWAIPLDLDLSGIAADSEGNVYLAGSFEGTATLGSSSLASRGDSDLLVVKLDSTGAVLWAASGGSSGADAASAIATDGAGNSYVAGNFAWTPSFGTIALDGWVGLFIAKLDSAGKWRWASAGAGDALDGAASAEAIAVNGSARISVMGSCDGPASFGAITLPDQGEAYPLVAAADGSGAWQGAEAVEAADRWQVADLAVDSAGNSYLAGSAYIIHDDRVRVAKLDSAGAMLWTLTAGGVGNNDASAVAVDSAGDVYVAGRFTGKASLGSTTLTTWMADGFNLFVWKIDP